MNMKKAKKFAVPLNISVAKEMYDRAQNLQRTWDNVSWEKFNKRFRMSDLGELVWEIGLSVLEELDKGGVMDAIAKEAVSEELIKIEVRKAKKGLKAPKAFSDLTDNQIEAIAHGDKDLPEV
jgi:hypothetical protein